MLYEPLRVQSCAFVHRVSRQNRLLQLLEPGPASTTHATETNVCG